MSDQSQISATVSAATKEKLDRFSESHGLKKNFVVEQALLYFMEARRQLPDEALVPARLVVEDKTFDRIVEPDRKPPETHPGAARVDGCPRPLRSGLSLEATIAAGFRVGRPTSIGSSALRRTEPVQAAPGGHLRRGG